MNVVLLVEASNIQNAYFNTAKLVGYLVPVFKNIIKYELFRDMKNMFKVVGIMPFNFNFLKAHIWVQSVEIMIPF